MQKNMIVKELKKLLPPDEAHHLVAKPVSRMLLLATISHLQQDEVEQELLRIQAENRHLRNQLDLKETELHELEQAVLMATIERAVQTGEMQP
jgi:hypothetical protein